MYVCKCVCACVYTHLAWSVLMNARVPSETICERGEKKENILIPRNVHPHESNVYLNIQTHLCQNTIGFDSLNLAVVNDLSNAVSQFLKRKDKQNKTKKKQKKKT